MCFVFSDLLLPFSLTPPLHTAKQINMRPRLPVCLSTCLSLCGVWMNRTEMNQQVSLCLFKQMCVCPSTCLFPSLV